MPSKPKVYIAGVGLTPISSGETASISAATKALLDAGITFDDISQGVTGAKSEAKGAFKAFDEDGIAVDEVKAGSELEASIRHVKEKGAQSVLLIATDKSRAYGLVLVSEAFFWRHPYLQDSAVVINDSSQSNQDLNDLAQKVWALRGWSKKGSSSKSESSGKLELSRADGSKIPKWEEVEHRQDGKHRLGHNPASETKEISQEDFEAVRASGKDQKGKSGSGQFKRKGGDRAALAKL